jgi:predicted RNA-binding protein YlqC (UPF0109 family)
MKKIIETIAQALVDQPDHVSVTEIDGLQTSIVELTVAKADIPGQDTFWSFFERDNSNF